MKMQRLESLEAVYIYIYIYILCLPNGKQLLSDEKNNNINKNEQGITIISLVVTVIILLILSGVAIRTISGDNGLIARTKSAVEESKKAEYQEGLDTIGLEVKLKATKDHLSNAEFIEEYKKELEEETKKETIFKGSKVEKKNDQTIRVETKEGYIFYVREGKTIYIGRVGEVEEKEDDGNDSDNEEGKDEDFGELKVGDYVRYSPEANTYTMDPAYSGTDKNVLLGNKSNVEINDWRVFSITEDVVELISEEPTKNDIIYFNSSQGYNNFVKLLNDACSELYGNQEKGITARNINIDDIEKVMTEASKEQRFTDVDPTGLGTYLSRQSTPSTVYNWYPTIHIHDWYSGIYSPVTENGGPNMRSIQYTFVSTPGITQGTLLTTKTVYHVNIKQNFTFIDDYYYQIFYNKRFWISSRGTYYLNDNCCVYCAYCLDTTSDWFYASDNSSRIEGQIPRSNLRPILTLNKSLLEKTSKDHAIVK